MKAPQLWLQRLARERSWRFWLVVHIVALALQWATLSEAPLAMEHRNDSGWWALCVTAKGP